jgi:hypothetical protein
MRVRKVDANGDAVFGGGQQSFWRNVPEAVGQVVESRLNLWSRQWYLDYDEGTAYQTQVLGKRTEALRDTLLQARILDTPGVTEIVDYGSTLNRDTRSLAVAAQISTAYSTVDISGSLTNQISIRTDVDVRDGR